MAGVKTGLVKQALVRYIRERELRRGDRLPPQGTLRKSSLRDGDDRGRDP